MYDCHFKANGRLSLCSFNQDFWEDEVRCCGKLNVFYVFRSLCLCFFPVPVCEVHL